MVNSLHILFLFQQQDGFIGKKNERKKEKAPGNNCFIGSEPTGFHGDPVSLTSYFSSFKTFSGTLKKNLPCCLSGSE